MENTEKWLEETKSFLSKLKFEADIYDNELEELFKKGLSPLDAAHQYYKEWNEA